MYKLLVLMVLIANLQYIHSYVMDSMDENDEREFLDKMEASQFMKRLFNPLKSKNEEVKRETVERYEEKCRSIIPTKRFCPKIRQWQAFRHYENGE